VMRGSEGVWIALISLYEFGSMAKAFLGGNVENVIPSIAPERRLKS